MTLSLKSGVLSLIIVVSAFTSEGANCQDSNPDTLSETVKRYISYDVSDSEGFNSRIDVFIRAATLLKLLPKKQNWVLVLPPWNHLVHWKSPLDQEHVSWKTFFNVESLEFLLDVIEMSEFLKMNRFKFDKVFVLQSDMLGKINDGESVIEAPCLIDPGYYRDINGMHRGMLGYEDLFVEKYKCMSIHGRGIKLLDLIQFNVSATRFVDDFWILSRKH